MSSRPSHILGDLQANSSEVLDFLLLTKRTPADPRIPSGLHPESPEPMAAKRATRALRRDKSKMPGRKARQ